MSQQGGISPVLRGFEANRVLLVVDGVRLNNAIYRSGHLQNAGSVDPFGVRRTDIIMGPSSVMYGSDALGGVVHFMTPTPGFHDGGTAVDGRVVAQGSTANQGWAGHVHVATRAPSFGTVTQVTRREFGHGFLACARRQLVGPCAHPCDADRRKGLTRGQPRPPTSSADRLRPMGRAAANGMAPWPRQSRCECAAQHHFGRAAL